MNEQDAQLPLSLEREIDALCREFERQWRAKEDPLIEEFVSRVGEEGRSAAIRELIAQEADMRQEAGETVEAEEYHERFPADRAEVDAAFQLLRRPNNSGRANEETGPAPARNLIETHDTDRKPTPCDESDPSSIGRYKIQERIGEGAFGRVYRARDEDLQRDVAIKVSRPDRFLPGDVDRMLEEARAVAQLEKHSNTVEVYDVGRLDDGSCFVVLELIQGRTLQEEIEQGRLSQERAWEVMLHVTAAIQHAHARGLVHRDLKPANILLDADGNAHVADFGLAISDQTHVNKASDVSGTPAYMAPEQVQGDAHQLDGRADIWAIGVILYELFTGHRPFHGDDRDELFDEIVHRTPKPPRQIDPQIPAAVERVCLKCLSKSITDRYLSAADLAKDLRDAQFSRQRRARRLGVLAAVAVVILLAIGGLWAYFAALSDEPIITIHPDSGLTIRMLATLRGHTQEVWSAAFAPDDKTLFSGGVDKVIKIWDTEDFHERGELVGHEGEVRSVCCSPDGHVLASAANDKTIVLWDIGQTQPQHAIVGHSDDVRAVAFSPTGDSLLSGSIDKTVRAWDPESGSERQLFTESDAAVQCVAYSPDGTTVAVGGDDRAVHLLDRQSGDELRSFSGHGDGVCYVAFSPDGTRMASASWDNTVRVWDVTTGDQPLSINGHEDGVRCVVFSPDGKRLATAGGDNSIRLWDADTGAEHATLRAHSKAVTCVAFSSDGRLLASASGDKTVKLWQIEVEEEEQPDEPAEPPLETIAKPSPEPPEFISIDLTEPPNKEILKSLVVEPPDLPGVGRWQIESVFPRTETTSVSWSPDGKEIACGTQAGWVRIYDVASGRLVRLLDCEGRLIRSLAYRPVGEPLLAVGSYEQIELWLPDGKPIRTFGSGWYLKSVAWSPSGEWLAALRHNSPVELWKTDGTAGPVLGDEPHRALAWSPDGATIATSGPDERIEFWRPDGTRVDTLNDHKDVVLSLAFSSDGRLASSSRDKTVRLWNADHTPGPVLVGPKWVGAEHVSWSPDGTHLVSAGGSGIQLWTKDARHIKTFDAPVIGCDVVDWSPDGERLVFAFRRTPEIGCLSKNGDPVGTLPDGHVKTQLRWAPKGNRLATIGNDAFTRLFDANGRALGTFVHPESKYGSDSRCLAWSADGGRFATGHANTLQLRNSDGTTCSVPGHEDGVFRFDSGVCSNSLAWSPKGGLLAVGQNSGAVRLLGEDGGVSHLWKGHDHSVSGLAWSPDGRWLMSLDWHGRLILRRDSGEITWKVDLQETSTHSPFVTWNPNGEWFAIRYSPFHWRVHSTQGKSAISFERVSPMAWRPDGQFMAMAGHEKNHKYDEVILVTPDGKPHRRLGPPRIPWSLTISSSDARSVSLDWSGDGRRLAVAGNDSTICTLDTETGQQEWVALLIDNGKSVTISAAGEIIDGDPETIEQQLVYLVELPDGSSEILTHSEFYQRVDAARSELNGDEIPQAHVDGSSRSP